ncbi:MAG: single-stranded-DNA-specific exonuclease RecJ, partial [Bacteroidota bacterium]
MTKQWVFGAEQPDEQIHELAKTLNISKGIAEILLRRGIKDFKSAKAFFRPQLEDLHDPFLMKNLGHAVNRLSEAIFAGEKIMIYGDYDVDGTTSVSLIYRFLREFSDALHYYIPDRYKEGYGISEQGIRHAKDLGVSVMIALDCGIRAVGQATLAKSLGIDLIVCDHHLPGDQLPDAFAILDPKQSDCTYPFKELSGCGVGFKLLQGFCQQNTIPLYKLFQQLDLLAVSIASDIVPIIDENRVLAFYGLKKLNSSPSVGLKALMDVGVLKNKLSITNVVFGIGPRINAAGRIGHAKMAVELLVSDNPEEARAIAAQVNEQNSERKDLDKAMTEEAIAMIEQGEEIDYQTTVLYKPDWHKGVIGIVASRCIEKYYRPTIILTSSNEVITGSARSVAGFDIHDAIAACEDVLLQYGGHKYAAGLTMSPQQFPEFRKRFEQIVN